MERNGVSQSAIPPEVLAEVIRIASPTGSAFLVGGQALNFWAERYYSNCPELAQYGPYASKDVDFFGTSDAADKLAKALGGKAIYPQSGDHTPQSAIVSAVVLGHKIEIDFLWNVLGPPADQVKKQMVHIDYPIRPADNSKVPISVMHPLHCLQSRAANVITLKRTSATAMRQLNAAPIVLREYISEAIGEGQDPSRVRVAISILRQLGNYLTTDIVGSKIHTITQYNPINVFKKFSDSPLLDERFKDNQLQSLIRQIEEKQKITNSKAAQFRAGPGFGM